MPKRYGVTKRQIENMKRVKIENIENFFDLVHGMEVNTYYELPDNCRYKWIKIEKGSEYYSKETYFCWAMECNYKVSGCVGYIHPLVGSNKVAHFKTEKGCKTSFIKRYREYFESLEINVG